MAVIKIPSKHIYEMQNEKVIDNDIDKIEVQAKTVVPDNHYDETVYNEELKLSETAESYENHSATTFTAPNSGGNTIRYGTVLTGLYVVAKYHTIPQLLIPKQSSATQRIVKINDDIKYRVSFEAQYYKKNTSYNVKTNVIDYTGGSNTLIEQKQNISTFNDVSVEYEQNASAISDHLSSTTAGSLRSLTATNSLKLYPEATAENNYSTNYSSVRLKAYLYADSVNWVIPNSERHYITKEIVKDFAIFSGGEISDDSKNYIISNIKVLSSIEAYALSTVSDFGDKPENLNGYAPIGGLYIKTVPKGTIELTVYGNTIGIDLQDNTITIGDGKNVISFQGNELVQTTNSPSIESQYQTVLNEWKEGKETATLRCGIADYYGVSVTQLFEGGEDLLLPSGDNIHVQYIDDNKVYCSATPKTILPPIGTVFMVKGCQVTLIDIYFDRGQVAVLYPAYGLPFLVSKEGKYGLPMTFQIGDIVQPYVFGANGKDRPMSTYGGGVPKNFEVISKRITYDGAVWQEIGLQEYIQKHTVNFYIGIPAQTPYTTVEVVTGKQVEPIPNPPTIKYASGEKYAFTGWWIIEQDGTKFPYNFSMPIISDLNIGAEYKYAGTEM